jgi:hypothetical protein
MVEMEGHDGNHEQGDKDQDSNQEEKDGNNSKAATA